MAVYAYLCSSASVFKQKTEPSKRLKEGLKIFRESAELDEKASARRANIPADWRSRILR